MKPSMFIGIDPGVHTGFAIWDATTRKFLVVASTTIVRAMVRVEKHHQSGALHSVTFEDARLRTWFGDKGREALQGAGSIKRDCQVWAEWLEHVGCPYKNVSPKAKGPKRDAETFKRLSGWNEQTNEHGRDAAMLVLERT